MYSIKQLKERIKDLPDDMIIITGYEGQINQELSDDNFYVASGKYDWIAPSIFCIDSD